MVLAMSRFLKICEHERTIYVRRRHAEASEWMNERQCDDHGVCEQSGTLVAIINDV